jgi:2-keto-3-deoxy-L-rhamnonate aldolase RhmA
MSHVLPVADRIVLLELGAAGALSARGRAQLRRSALRDAAGARRRLRDPAACLSDDRDQRGVRNVASIAAVEGISGLHIGPVDLGLGLGLDRDDSRFADALRSIVASGHAAGLSITMHAVRPDQSRRMVGHGLR